MGFDDFLGAAKGILTTIAPTVATAFGGPFAGMATQKLITALGLDPNTSQDDVMKAVAGATPDQMLAIKKAEQEFILDCKRLDVEVLKLQAGDRASARDREAKTGDSWTPRILAGCIIGLYIGVQYYVLGHVIDPSMREVVMRSLGTLDAAVGLILGYYFGSSLGSAQKSEHITTLTTKE